MRTSNAQQDLNVGPRTNNLAMELRTPVFGSLRKQAVKGRVQLLAGR